MFTALRRFINVTLTVLFGVVLLLSGGCSTSDTPDPQIKDQGFKPEIPEGFPQIDYPEDNAFKIKRFQLGRRLFFEPALSIDSSISCGTCHDPQLAFADDLPVTPGVKGRKGRRNSPSLFNVAYHPYFMREGGVPTLEQQVLVPIQEHSEMAFNIVKAGERLAQNPEYMQMSRDAYDRDMDYYVISRALSNFQRALLSGNSPYDENERTGSGLTSEELAGRDLFFSSITNCSQCHSGFNFTNYEFKNNGLSEVYNDVGRFILTGDSSDLAMFKTPSLRNVELTAPYMHNGSFASLTDVVEHYNSGGAAHHQKSSMIKPLGLTEGEKKQLIAFLKSLTDHDAINNANYVP